jgi:hypothetical protein
VGSGSGSFFGFDLGDASTSGFGFGVGFTLGIGHPTIHSITESGYLNPSPMGPICRSDLEQYWYGVQLFLELGGRGKRFVLRSRIRLEIVPQLWDIMKDKAGMRYGCKD